MFLWEFEAAMKGYAKMHWPEQEAAQPPSVEEAKAAFLRLAEQASE